MDTKVKRRATPGPLTAREQGGCSGACRYQRLAQPQRAIPAPLTARGEGGCSEACRYAYGVGGGQSPSPQIPISVSRMFFLILERGHAPLRKLVICPFLALSLHQLLILLKARLSPSLFNITLRGLRGIVRASHPAPLTPTSLR